MWFKFSILLVLSWFATPSPTFGGRWTPFAWGGGAVVVVSLHLPQDYSVSWRWWHAGPSRSLTLLLAHKSTMKTMAWNIILDIYSNNLLVGLLSNLTLIRVTLKHVHTCLGGKPGPTRLGQLCKTNNFTNFHWTFTVKTEIEPILEKPVLTVCTTWKQCPYKISHSCWLHSVKHLLKWAKDENLFYTFNHSMLKLSLQSDSQIGWLIYLTHNKQTLILFTYAIFIANLVHFSKISNKIFFCLFSQLKNEKSYVT